MARRQKSVDEVHAQEGVEREKSSKAILTQEKEVIDHQMTVERHERRVIKNKKKAELNAAQDTLFADLDEVNLLDSKLTHQGASAAAEFERKKKEALQEIENAEKNEKKENQFKMGQGEDIFNVTDCDENVKSYQAGEKIG
jgi:hypothetical protein